MWRIFLENRFLNALESQRSFLKVILCSMCFLNSVFFVIFSVTHIGFIVNFVSGCIYGVLLFQILTRPYNHTNTYIMLATANIQVVVLSVGVGGANSPILAWLVVMSVPALFLIGRGAALILFLWVGLVLALLAKLTENGALDAFLLRDVFLPEYAFWGMSLNINALLSLICVMLIYVKLHRRRLKELHMQRVNIESARNELSKAESHKDEFIAAVSHELRTPMIAIMGLNDILQSEIADDPAALEYTQYTRRSAGRLLTVIDEILDYSKLQAGKLQVVLQPLPLLETLQKAFDSERAKTENRAVEWRLELATGLPAWVRGDPFCVSRVLGLLLNNAEKFTKAGTVTLSASVKDDGVLFAIEDTGIGIPENNIETIFRRFEYGDRELNRRYGGTGLGLSICERLVTLHEGRIGVENVNDKGSRFWFWLPLEQCPAPAQAASAKASPGPLPAESRILLVDDNRINRLVLVQMLRKFWPGVQVDEAADGNEGLELLRTQSYDLILMDMLMPGMDGMEATRIIRRELPEPRRHIPVLGLTASSSHEDRDNCLQSGMDCVITKPVEPQELLSNISSLLGSRHGENATGARQSADEPDPPVHLATPV